VKKVPNWCYGWVEVTGKQKNVKDFCKLFIFDDDTAEEGKNFAKKKYFARSFMNRDWKGFEEEHFKDNKPDEIVEISFGMDFAWSCHTCIIDGYPYKKGSEKCKEKECVTLIWACKKYKVNVHITTEETGCCFEEDITCDNKGNLDEQCKDMPVHKCYNCGEECAIPSSYDLDDETCYNCGEIAWTDKLADMLKRKLETNYELKTSSA
jgi:hypothetical protein